MILAASKHTTPHLGKPHYKELASQKTVKKSVKKSCSTLNLILSTILYYNPDYTEINKIGIREIKLLAVVSGGAEI